MSSPDDEKIAFLHQNIQKEAAKMLKWKVDTSVLIKDKENRTQQCQGIADDQKRQIEELYIKSHEGIWDTSSFGLVWFGYAAATTVTHWAPTGDSHPRPTRITQPLPSILTGEDCGIHIRSGDLKLQQGHYELD